MWVRLTHGLSVAIPCAVLSATVSAEDDAVRVGTSIDFARAMALTLERSPSLVVAGHQIDIESARLIQARLAPNPDLTITVENVAGSGPSSGVDDAETTISIGWLLEPGKRDRRIDAAQAGVSLAETDREIHRLDAAADTARLFLECLSFDARLEQATDAITLAETSVLMASKRVEAGRSPAADRARAQAELSRLRLAKEELEHGLLVATRHLAAQWGESEPSFETVNGQIDLVPKIASYESLLRRVHESPDQSRFFNEQRLLESEVRVAEGNAAPNWRISAGVRRFESSDSHALVAVFNVPLAIRNRNQGRIAAAKAALELSTSRRAASLLQLETRLFAIYQDLQHSLHEAKAFKSDILPKVEAALEETERAYAAGRYSFSELSVARSELLTARVRSIQAVVDAFRSIVEIERLTGVSLSSSLGRGGAT